MAGCPYSSKQAAPPEPKPAPRDPLAELVAAVGAKPRVAGTLSLDAPVFREALAALEGLPPMLGGRAFGDCGVSLAALGRVRLAVGEPLVVAAELDGPIDRERARCILGDELMASLGEIGVVLRDRPGGLSISYGQPSGSAARVAPGEALAARCAGHAACAALRLGPAGKELAIEVRIEGGSMTWRLGGPGLSRPAADAFAAAVKEVAARSPALARVVARSGGGELVVTLADADGEETPRALKEHLVEAFRAPSSSMVPTLQVGDQFFIAKGPLRGPITPGTVVVFRTGGGVLYTKRVIAAGGQTVKETEAGIEIDGVPLATRLVDASYRYEDSDESTGETIARDGRLVREQLGRRSYQILRMREGRPGSWTVPAGHYFLLGDNRDNSNDSRYMGPVPEDAIVGRVFGIWLAMRGEAPDWNRMGVGID